jgi:hypothetical protein
MNHFFPLARRIIYGANTFYPSVIHHHRTFSNTTTAIMAKTLKEAFQQGELFSDTETYTFLKLPVASIAAASNAISNCQSATAFRGLLYDKYEITMMIPESDYIAQKGTLQVDGDEVGEYSYRLITFDVVLDPNLIGFMHAVTKVLAAEGISVLPFAAYSRDHIFVQDKDFDKAMGALECLKEIE